MTSTSGTPSPRRRRRRARAKAPAPNPSAVAVLEQARAPELDSLPDEPLSPAEVSRMKATLRFLREHRETLKLKVNAAEDLLLNGRREPTHRGLLRHLLSKLDRARVLSASERLPPREATELLAGIVRFAPEIPYVVRFLQCVKVSADRGETAAALTRALEQLDFGETSPAQLRDILLLIVDVFPSEELPVFALSLLSRREFRAAVERSSEGWPASLLALLLPLEALRAWIDADGARGRRPRDGKRLSLPEVHQGARLLVAAGRASLLELPDALHRPLFELGCAALRPALGAEGDRMADALGALLERLQRKRAEPRLAQQLAAAFLRTGREKRARELLRGMLEAAGHERTDAKRWLDSLEGERIGDVVVSGSRRNPGPRREAAPANGTRPAVEGTSGRWQRGWHVPTQSDVLVRAGAAVSELRNVAELWKRARLPAVAPLLAVSVEGGGSVKPHLVAVSPGPPLPVRLRRGDGDPERLRGWCVDICVFMRGLAALGLELPDAALSRFNVDAAERLWLGDLWGIREAVPAEVELAHARLARAACIELSAALDYDFVEGDVRARLDSEMSLLELIEVLAARR
jgi:hypothetical protein